MKNFDLVNYLKNNFLINEIKAVPSAGYLEIKLSPENEYGEARDIEKIIIPKYSYKLNQGDIDYLQSKETIIPEEEGFFPYLHAVLEEYVEKSKGENLYKLSVRNQLVQDLVNDLHLYIKANNVTSLGDTSPRDDVYYVLEEYLDKIFPNLSEDWDGYFERRNGIDALEENDYEYFIRTLFGGVNENDDINEIKAVRATKYNKLIDLILKDFEDVIETHGYDPDDLEDMDFNIDKIRTNLNSVSTLNDIEEIFFYGLDGLGYETEEIYDRWVDILKEFIEQI